MIIRNLAIAVFVALVLWSSPGRAACTGPAGDEGDMFYNGDDNVYQYCNGTDWMATASINPGAGGSGCSGPSGVEGDMIYNGAPHHVMQFCDGDDWIAMGGFSTGGGGSAGCTAPTLCPNVGNVCDDGNAGTTSDPIFAGFMVDGSSCEALFVTNDNQSTGSAWKTSSGADDIATDSIEYGLVNDGQVPDDTAFPAFKLCKDLSDGGFTDWYFPARDELHLLWKNRSAINANAAGAFTTGYYISSSEVDTANVWGQNFNTGGHSTNPKIDPDDVRCVRRDVSSGGGGGLDFPAWLGSGCTSGYCGGSGSYKIVFITAQAWDGNLGGITGADAKCQAAADGAGLSGTYEAWVTTTVSTTSPSNRFTQSSTPYVLVDGTQIAANYAGLTDGTIDNPIILNEYGGSGGGGVWTNTTSAGSRASSTAGDACNSWASNDGATYGGIIGLAGGGITDAQWAVGDENGDDMEEACNLPQRLHCFEQ